MSCLFNGAGVTVMANSDCVEMARNLAERIFLGTDLACFTAGTRIETEVGLVAVEDLRDGMLVETMDNGLQPLRRVLCKRVAGIGSLAPVVIEAGVFGNARALRLSPHHRMVVSGWRAELLTGEPEVLAAAGDLVDGQRVRREEAAEVDYFHLLFDRHEIIFAEGAATESYHPFSGAGDLSAATRREIVTIFRDLAPTHAPDLMAAGDLPFWEGTLMGATARPCARPEEAALMLA
ncbi:MAG: Hint domain-containing protein [Rhodobacteraceae bacterium]|nr:Hint domain-containing protein [Paracoccaceae bacterium]